MDFLKNAFKLGIPVIIFASFSYSTQAMLPAACSDGLQNQDETGIDIGGICSPTVTQGYLTIDYGTNKITSFGGYNGNTNGIFSWRQCLGIYPDCYVVQASWGLVGGDPNFYITNNLNGGVDPFAPSGTNGSAYGWSPELGWTNNGTGVTPSGNYYLDFYDGGTIPYTGNETYFVMTRTTLNGMDIWTAINLIAPQKLITSFNFEGLNPVVNGIINQTDHTIALTVPFGTDVTTLTPTIVISTGATVTPSTDIPQNFSNSVTYTVTATDGTTQTYTVTVTPSCVTDCFSNVLFIPGIEASRLYTKDTNGNEKQLWEPHGNGNVESLYLNSDGASIDPNIYTKDIIKESNTPFPMGSAGQNIYKSFSNTMDQLATDQKINEWQAFAYDWRQSPDDVVVTPQKYNDGTTLSLMPLLKVLEQSSKNGKVTIVTHSNGGLVAKALLKKLQDDKNAGINNLIDNVDVLIMVAAPEIGTASATPAIMHGYDQAIVGGWLMDETHARELGRNMPGAYGLLPSKAYIDHVSASPATFVDNTTPSNTTTKLVQTFGSAISSYDEYKDFLFGAEGRVNPLISETKLPISLSQSLFTKAENLHNSIDVWTPPASLKVIEVAGWGLDTVASFEYYPKLVCPEQGFSGACGYVMDERPHKTVDGDGIVVEPSAHYTSFIGGAKKYWVDLPEHNRQLRTFRRNREHKDIFEVASLNTLIQSVINNKDIVLDTVLKDTEPIDTKNRFRISIHSPVTLDAYDSDGNHTGKICPTTSDFCHVDENIVNSSYMEFGEGKYLSLPEDGIKTIKLSGIGTGTFTFDLDELNGDTPISSTTFKDIPVTTTTKVSIDLQNDLTTLSPLHIDTDGNGTVDFNLAPKLNGVVTMPSPLTVSAVNKAITVGSPIPAFTATLSGFDATVTNDVSGSANCTTTVLATSQVGTYPIVCTTGTLFSNNYYFKTFVPGSLKIVYGFPGFLQPINDTMHQIGQSLSVFKAGSTVPVKFQLKKSDGTMVQARTLPIWLSPQKGSSMSATVDESVYSGVATSGTAFKWDGSQYIYNWSTKGLSAGYWYKISVQLDDGNVYFVTVGLK